MRSRQTVGAARGWSSRSSFLTVYMSAANRLGMSQSNICRDAAVSDSVDSRERTRASRKSYLVSIALLVNRCVLTTVAVRCSARAHVDVEYTQHSTDSDVTTLLFRRIYRSDGYCVVRCRFVSCLRDRVCVFSVVHINTTFVS